MEKLKKIFEKTYVAWIATTLVCFVALVCGHVAVWHSLPISSLWRDPLFFLSFYSVRLVVAMYLGYLLLIVIGKVKAFRNNTSMMQFGAAALGIFVQMLLFLCILMDVFGPLSEVSVCSWLAKISISMLIGSLVLLMRRKWWIIVLEAILGVWIFAEIVNYRAFGFFLDGLSVTLVSNMGGFWDSVPQYIRWYDYFAIFLPLLLTPLFLPWLKQDKERHWSDFAMVWGIAIALNIAACYGLTKEHFSETHHPCPTAKEMVYNPLGESAVGMMTGADRKDYIDKFSVYHSFFFSTRELAAYLLDLDKPELTEEEKEQIAMFMKPVEPVHPERRLIVVLVESLEDWVVRPDVMPNLCAFMDKQPNLLYAQDAISQRKAGSSADGQLIVNTGLVPVNTGTVAFKYCYNVFPSLSEMYDNACGIFPHGLSVWNQKQMSDAYGLDSNYVVSEHDREIFETVVDKAQLHDYVLAITLSSHAPFDIWADSSTLSTPEGMPTLMRDYIKSINFMDAGLGVLLEAMESDSVLQNTVLMITGDHSIFNDEQLGEFRGYVKRAGLDYDLKRHNCPVIVYAPQWEGGITISEPVYQMDIYPTLLNAIGAEDYYWQGFGVDLHDTATIKNRKMPLEDIDALSDRVIRANYFKEYVEQGAVE